MDSRVFDPDDARRRLEAWQGRIDKLAANTQAMSERFQELRVTAADSGGLAEVTVDSSGSVVDLRLGQQIQRMAPEAVARTILSVIRDAKAKLAERSQEIVEETVGSESGVGRAVAEQVGRQLRPPARDDQVDEDEPTWRGLR
ncbi:YbaB/EbfC family nucleoid-associated protein [Actinosynnema sp. CS-041913]|uniref:YbaB/EbfC family nucleoid-associated protein n=1 Tax=Actinosynnema sp. CS-041913 TaxID=3239917 RepID=UPI003D89C9C5